MDYLTLKDISNGPGWVMYAVAIGMGLLSLLLISGKGSWLIAGYNTASKKEKAKYDEKLLCKVVGVGLLVIAAAVLFMAIFESVLPAPFTGIFLFIVFMDIALIFFLSNTICRTDINNSDQQEETK
jgi:hypothetical protein